MLYQCVWQYGPSPGEGFAFNNDGRGYPSESKALWHGQRERGRRMREQARDAAAHPERVRSRAKVGLTYPYPLGTLTVKPFRPSESSYLYDG